MSIERLQGTAILIAITLLVMPVSYGQVTFIKDIAPIIQTKCTPCHRPGEAAPFSLISYDDVVKRASFIKEVVQKKYMPPWKADNHYVAYANDRSLSNSEIAKIVKWVNDKTPKGIIKDKEETTTIPLIEGTAYKRQPDIVLKASSTYKLPGDNYERFIVYKIPFELPDSAAIEAVEFFCDNKKIIHHVNYAVHEVPAEIDINGGPDFVNLTEDDRSKYAAYIPFK
ncbi:MAG TPA: hypothetical protein VJ111_09605, partial [Chitinophagaceae bacterium]|nr:hypothetical protein [Chitinophagaceae bacterium]